MRATLRTIFNCGETKFYDVVLTDDKLISTRNLILTLEKLQELAGREECKCDFSIEDGILWCSPDMPLLPVDAVFVDKVKYVAGTMNSTPSDGTIFRLLQLIAENDYLILDQDLSAEEYARGEGVARFVDVHFSESTMTVYARMHKNQGIYNCMLVRHDGKKALLFNKFRVATKMDVVAIPGCKDLNKEVVINSVKYKLWETEVLSVCDEVVIAGGIINRAAAEVKVYRGALVMCDRYISMVTKYLGNETAVKWSGGDTSYKSPYGVYLESTISKLSTNITGFIEDEVLHEFANGGTRETATNRVVAMLDKIGGNSIVNVYAASVYAGIAATEGDASQKLSVAIDTKKLIGAQLFWRAMYLYRVRAYSFLTETRLCSGSSGYVTGGNLKEYTKVKARYY